MMGNPERSGLITRQLLVPLWVLSLQIEARDPESIHAFRTSGGVCLS